MFPGCHYSTCWNSFLVTCSMVWCSSWFISGRSRPKENTRFDGCSWANKGERCQPPSGRTSFCICLNVYLERTTQGNKIYTLARLINSICIIKNSGSILVRTDAEFLVHFISSNNIEYLIPLTEGIERIRINISDPSVFTFLSLVLWKPCVFRLIRNGLGMIMAAL